MRRPDARRSGPDLLAGPDGPPSPRTWRGCDGSVAHHPVRDAVAPAGLRWLPSGSASLGSGYTDLDEVQGVDPAVADGDAAGLGDRVAQGRRPQVLDEGENGGTAFLDGVR